MPLTQDPEFAQATAAKAEAIKVSTPAADHDIQTRRTRIAAAYEAAFSKLPATPDVKHEIHQIQSYDGQTISVYRFFKPSGGSSGSGSAILHTHGGGTIQGDVKQFIPWLSYQVQQTGVQMFSVDYRLAPEHPFPTPEEDSYAGLTWLYEHADEFGVDRSRIATAGESAGGKLAMGLSLMARDRKLSPPLAKQILIYPMLDDRTTGAAAVNPALESFAEGYWSYSDNFTAWTALLGKDVIGTDDNDKVSPYAAPGRAENVVGLPPTYIEVGELDIFRDEDIALAGRIAAANISVEVHVHPGVPHAFEVFAPHAGVTQRAMADRLRMYSSV